MTKRFKKKAAVLFILSIILIFGMSGNWFSVLFQRGNPIPYLAAAIRISGDRPYVRVDAEDAGGIYISKRVKGQSDVCEALLHDVAYSKGYAFAEQAGSGYIFSDGTNPFVISSEIYLKYFIVWTVPDRAM